MRVQLEAGAAAIGETLQKMSDHRRQLLLAIEWTGGAVAALDAAAAPQPPPLPDDVVVATSPLGGRLLAAVAASRALEDALYVLAQALEGREGPPPLDCETFTKEHRKLCLAQFMHLALIRKIHETK